MMRRIAITGVGALSPYGNALAEICAGATQPLDRFALVKGPDSARFINARRKRKLDRFTVLGLCAAGMALEDSKLTASGIAPERIGIFVGNCLGGWSFTEPELRRLHTQGVGGMSPYVATAWFPAAVQGQISLDYGIKGHSKTFSHDVAGLTALGQAMRAIANGRVDAAVCGATESLDSDYLRAVLASGSGAKYAEGAAFLTLERLDRATARGARVYAELAGYTERFAGDQSEQRACAHRTVREAMPSDSALVIHCGEIGEETRSPFVQMFALSGVLEVVCAAWILGQCPCTKALGRPWSEGFDDVAVVSAGRSGSVASLGISRMKSLPVKEDAGCRFTRN
jgi:3-oxoacyl-[acyl-carrier-protein] synthase II